MASTCLRSLNRISLSPLRRNITQAKTASGRALPTNTSIFGSASPYRISGFSIISRSPVELGCCSGSMYPLHSAVAVARLTSRLSLTSQSCRNLSQGTLCRTSPGL